MSGQSHIPVSGAISRELVGGGGDDTLPWPVASMPSPLHPDLILALLTYLVGTASPGPSNLAIMSAAMGRGRPQALALASGVLGGSILWGLAAAFGLAAVMRLNSWSLLAVKILGGLYLLRLGWKAARESWAPASAPPQPSSAQLRLRHAFAAGLAMHLANPKAIFVWLSLVALALPVGSSRAHAFLVVGACAALGALVFFAYAVAFSTTLARKIYQRLARPLNAVLCLAFIYAGIRMLISAMPGT